MSKISYAPIFACLVLPPTLATAQSPTTGTYCNNNQVVSYYCNGSQPDSSWNPKQNNCFEKVKGLCSALQDTNPVFDPNQYGIINGDVAAAGVDRLQHWQQYGKGEGRASSDGFQVRQYLGAPGNEDLKGQFGTNWIAAIQHYANYGFHEGRATRSTNINDPSWAVDIYNPPNTSTAPRDNNYNVSIIRAGNASRNAPIDTGFDTSPITGMPNTRRVKGKLIGPAQKLIDGQWGFTGFQQYGGQFGMGIDSRSVKDAANAYSRSNKASNPALADAVLTNVVGKAPPTNAYWAPWLNGAQGLRTFLELRIPFAGGLNGGGSQVNTYYFIYNTKTKVGFYFGVAIFDTRPSAIPQSIYVVKDECGMGCSGVNIYLVSLHRNQQTYITVPSFSAESTSSTFKETRPFVFEITSQNLRNLIAYAKAQQPNYNLTDDVNDYVVSDWNLNPEVFSPIDTVGNFAGDGWIGLSGKIQASGPK